MNYILFEDNRHKNFKPFSLTHAIYEIRTGIFSNIQRVVNFMGEDDTLTLLVRDELTEVVRERYPSYAVNPERIPPGIWLNGSYFWSFDYVDKLEKSTQYHTAGGFLAAFVSGNAEKSGKFPNLENYYQETMQVEGLDFIWDAVHLAGKYIKQDDISSLNLSSIDNSGKGFKTDLDIGGHIHPSVICVKHKEIYIGEGCEILAGVIMDASGGPIIIENNVKVDIGSMIKGPVYIGKGSTINPGTKIRENVSIGPFCKVGGEVEDSVIHGFSNKQHDGFLGHSYVGMWVNLGANTNTSDLKNNYGPIRINIEGAIIETGHKFLGLFIGDYSKAGISTMFNTGTYVGIGANIFGGDFQPKYIPSFSWGENDVTDLKKLLETCRVVKSRRGHSLTKSDIQLITYHYLLEKNC